MVKVIIKFFLFGFFFKGWILILEIIRKSYRMIIKLWVCVGNFYKRKKYKRWEWKRENGGIIVIKVIKVNKNELKYFWLVKIFYMWKYKFFFICNILFKNGNYSLIYLIFFFMYEFFLIYNLVKRFIYDKCFFNVEFKKGIWVKYVVI